MMQKRSFSISESGQNEESTDCRENERLDVGLQLSKTPYLSYLAHSTKNSETYLLKIFIHPDSSTINPLYTREARFLSFEHPNLVSILDVRPNYSLLNNGKRIRASYIITEKPKYGNFYNLIMHGHLPDDDVLNRTFFHQLIDGIEFIHSQGIAHMHLRPENIFLDTGYTLKIANFNYSQTPKEVSVVTHGHHNYLAPEAHHRINDNPMAADIYSAGLFLFIMRTRTFPYMVKEFNALFWKAFQKNYKSSESCGDFGELCEKMLANDPNARPTLKEIRKSKWFLGPTYSKKELENILADYLSS
mgnify:CR=1 FL=1